MKLLLAALLLTGCAAASEPEDVAHRIETESLVCSATAVAADTLETALHCLVHPLRTVDGTFAYIKSSQKIAPDRVRIVVVGVRFQHWAKLGKPVKGARVRWLGQTLGYPFVYREGHIVYIEKGAVVVDAAICKGDSGSGLINDAGELVGVISRMTNDAGCTFAVAE